MGDRSNLPAKTSVGQAFNVSEIAFAYWKLIYLHPNILVIKEKKGLSNDSL
jgi:hypothetical protein